MDRVMMAAFEAIIGMIVGVLGLAIELPIVGVLLAGAVGANFVAAGLAAWTATFLLGVIALAVAKRMCPSADGGRIIGFAVLNILTAIIYGVVLGIGGQTGFAVVVTLVWVAAVAGVTVFVPDSEGT